MKFFTYWSWFKKIGRDSSQQMGSKSAQNLILWRTKGTDWRTKGTEQRQRTNTDARIVHRSGQICKSTIKQKELLRKDQGLQPLKSGHLIPLLRPYWVSYDCVDKWFDVQLRMVSHFGIKFTFVVFFFFWFPFTFAEGRPMVNLKTIDSVSAKAIMKETLAQTIVIDSEPVTNPLKRSGVQSNSNISCRKRNLSWKPLIEGFFMQIFILMKVFVSLQIVSSLMKLFLLNKQLTIVG